MLDFPSGTMLALVNSTSHGDGGPCCTGNSILGFKLATKTRQDVEGEMNFKTWKSVFNSPCDRHPRDRWMSPMSSRPIARNRSHVAGTERAGIVKLKNCSLIAGVCLFFFHKTEAILSESEKYIKLNRKKKNVKRFNEVNIGAGWRVTWSNQSSTSTQKKWIGKKRNQRENGIELRPVPYSGCGNYRRTFFWISFGWNIFKSTAELLERMKIAHGAFHCLFLSLFGAACEMMMRKNIHLIKRRNCSRHSATVSIMKFFIALRSPSMFAQWQQK